MLSSHAGQIQRRQAHQTTPARPVLAKRSRELSETLFWQAGLRKRSAAQAFRPDGSGFISIASGFLSKQERPQGQAATTRIHEVELERSTPPIVGAAAKQLYQTAASSLDKFESRDLSISATHTLTDEDYESGDEGRAVDGTVGVYKANYEVVRLDVAGKVRRMHVKRRDLLREHGLQPRDLRRIDASTDLSNLNKTSPSITIKESVLLLNLGGIRAIVTAEKALFFEPNSMNTRKLLDTVVPRLQTAAGERLMERQQLLARGGGGGRGVDEGDVYRREAYGERARAKNRHPPFELEVLEGVLMVATGRLDAEVLNVTRRVSALLQVLPREINPVNLEELRRIKQALVELETKADTLREMLESLMDDEEELRELNLSSRPRREERQRQRERDRLERELERAREEIKEEERRSSSSSSGVGGNGSGGGGNGTSSSGGGRAQDAGSGGNGSNGTVHAQHLARSAGGNSNGVAQNGSSRPTSSSNGAAPARNGTASSAPSASSSSGSSPSSIVLRQQRMAELYAKHGKRRPNEQDMPQPGRYSSSRAATTGNGSVSGGSSNNGDLSPPRSGSPDPLGPSGLNDSGGAWERERDGGLSGTGSKDRRDDKDPRDGYQEAQNALDVMAEQEEEEQELEEVEDLLEYYLQRSTATQIEAERLLEGARDLEESIGVSLSARRYEVNRLELMLSMGSFAAGVGAMIAGIFGMNMRNTMEASVFGFWGTTALIVVLCMYVFAAIMHYTQKKRIL